MADITTTATTDAQQDAIRAGRFDDSLEETAYTAALGKALEAIQSSGWATPTGTLARTALSDASNAAAVSSALQALITDLKAKGILTA